MTEEQFTSAKAIEWQIDSIQKAKSHFEKHFTELIAGMQTCISSQDKTTANLLKQHGNNWETVMIADLNHRIQSLRQQFSEL